MNSKQGHFTLPLETGFFGYQGAPMGQIEVPFPAICARCSCGANSLKQPHALNCTFGKPIQGA